MEKLLRKELLQNNLIHKGYIIDEIFGMFYENPSRSATVSTTAIINRYLETNYEKS